MFESLRLGLRALFRRSRTERELDAELQDYLEYSVEKKLQSGMPREEALLSARAEFGSLESVKEDVRDVGWESMVDAVWRDILFALRTIRKNRSYTAVAVATMALGIGANTALFSVVNAVLLRPLPFHSPNQLVALGAVDLRDRTHGGEISYPAFLDWRSENHSLTALSAFTTQTFTTTDGDQPEAVPAAIVSANLFSLLGVAPAAGRIFSEHEDEPGDRLPVILSYEFAQSHFGGTEAPTGRTVTLDQQKYDIIGVMPAGFQFPVQHDRVEMWTTMAHDLEGPTPLATQRGASYLSMIGRLKPGIDIALAQSDLEAIQDHLNHQYPENRPRGVAIQSLADVVSGALKPALLLLMSAVAFVLLIACANVANLLLAHAAGRKREFTVRLVLGASRGAIVRQLLIESTLLSAGGAVLGLFLAQWTTAVLVKLSPIQLARVSEIGLDWRVLSFTALVTLLSGVLLGLAPLVQFSKWNLNHSLAQGYRVAGSSPGRVRNGLVVVQIAVTLVLSVGAGLFVRSLIRLQHVDPGFRPDHVLTFILDVPSSRHPREQRAAFIRELLDSVRKLPPVHSASAIWGLPLSDQGAFSSTEIEGRPLPPSERPRAAFRIVEANYFSTMGIRVLKGRTFTSRDEEGTTPLAIVNETFVRRVLNGEDPIGRRVKSNIAFGRNTNAPMREIIGVVNDVKSSSIRGDAVPEVYAPQTPSDFPGTMTIVVRTGSDPEFVLPDVRRIVALMDKQLPLLNVQTLEGYVTASISGPRFESLLLGTFAALAFALTSIGLYGVMSYSVNQRSREMGVRMALGAQRRDILAKVVREGLILVSVGIGGGLIAALLTTRLVRGLLYGIAPTDVGTFISVPIMLILVALLACFIPGRRATALDPMTVLREE